MKGARHPFLEMMNADVVPNDISADPDNRIVILTGTRPCRGSKADILPIGIKFKSLIMILSHLLCTLVQCMYIFTHQFVLGQTKYRFIFDIFTDQYRSRLQFSFISIMQLPA